MGLGVVQFFTILFTIIIGLMGNFWHIAPLGASDSFGESHTAIGVYLAFGRCNNIYEIVQFLRIFKISEFITNSILTIQIYTLVCFIPIFLITSKNTNVGLSRDCLSQCAGHGD